MQRLPFKRSVEYGDIVALLGSGSFGDVRVQCKKPCLSDTDKVAVKIARDYDGPIELSLLREAATLVRITHPNIVKLIDVTLVDAKIALVLPLAVSSLHDFIGDLPITTVGTIAYQIARALAYLESVNVWYRDLKPGNILLYHESCAVQNVMASTEIPTAVLADFGLARVGMCAYPNEEVEFSGTMIYSPPELLLGSKYTPASEIWALGCSLYEVITGRMLFDGLTNKDILTSIFTVFGTPSPIYWPDVRTYPGWDRDYERLPKATYSRLLSIDQGTRTVIEKMLTLNPQYRPTANQLVHDAALSQFRNSVEACNPFPEVTELDCITELDKYQQPISSAKWMTVEKRHIIADWLETLRSRTNASLRSLFLANKYVDMYSAQGNVDPEDVPLLAQVAIHITTNLLETFAVSLETVSDEDTDVDFFVQYEIDMLILFGFDLFRTTAYDELMAYAKFYTNSTIEVAVVLLRASNHTLLVYGTKASEIAYLVLALACSVTKHRFVHANKISKQRLNTLIRQYRDEISVLVNSGASLSVLRTSYGTFTQLLTKLPLGI